MKFIFNVKIPYSFFESSNYIAPDELFLYLKLVARRSYNFKTYTSVDILGQEIKYYKREDRNKKKVKDIIVSLLNKKFIIVNDCFVYSTLLIISFPFLDVKKEFVMIPAKKYEEFKTPEEFYIYSYIKKWGTLGCRKSLDEWTNLLNVKSNRTTKNLLYNMNEKNLIDIKSGAYYVIEVGEQRQEVNEYSITPQGEESKKRKKREKKVDKVENENIDTAAINTVDNVPERIKYYDDYYKITNIEDNILNGELLKEIDYVYMQEYGALVAKKVKKVFEIRFAGMKKSPKDFTKKRIKEWENNYSNWLLNKDKIDPIELLNEYGFIAKLKENGNYIPIKKEDKIDIDIIRKCENLIFKGFRKEKYLDEEYFSEANGQVHIKNYTDEQLIEMIRRIKSEGTNINVDFIEDYREKEYVKAQRFYSEQEQEQEVIKVKTNTFKDVEDMASL
jgi:hypothetical protein